METFLFTLALTSFILWLIIARELLSGDRKISLLRDVAPALPDTLPRVSVIIPARNEEKNIRAALRSVLTQDYGNLEFILINDRSTDATASILEEMSKAEPRLQVHTIAQLPPGWLGKNHALHYGAARASGDILLFTDADVSMQPDTITRAVSYLCRREVDHLCLMPRIIISGWMMGVFIMTFAICFLLYTLPWRAARPHSRKHIGIGAFNMIRAGAYRAIGGHRDIALRPDDDVKLGKIVKLHGYRQRLLHGESHLSVEWYGSMRELIDGLMKNAFAGVDYSIATVMGATLLYFTFFLWPYLALLGTRGATLALNLAAVILMSILCVAVMRRQRLSPWHCPGFPLGILLFDYILWRAMFLAIRNGGINWRGTHYALADLKANKV